jgi:hypothetical protein
MKIAVPDTLLPTLLSAPARAGLVGSSVTPTETVGIIIRDRDQALHTGYPTPRVDAFVYGECEPTPPTLPFGRWKGHR